MAPVPHNNPHWTEPLTFLVPCNNAALTSLRLRPNRFDTTDATEHNIRKPKGCRGGKLVVVPLHLAKFFRRHCVAVGFSRANEIVLPQAAGIAEHHFRIHFDLSSGQILLTDMSKGGTWVRSSPVSTYTKIRKSSCRITKALQVVVGRGDAACIFRFEHRALTGAGKLPSTMMDDYIASIQPPQPRPAISAATPTPHDGSSGREHVGRRKRKRRDSAVEWNACCDAAPAA